MTLVPAYVYMIRDVGGSLWGTLVFALAMLTPGYCLGRWSNVCGFRSRGLREQAAWSVVFSIGVGTLPLVGVVWLGGLVAGEVMLAALGVLAAVMVVRAGVRVDVGRREAWVMAGIAAAWALFVVGSLTDVGIGSRLWMSVTSYDHGLRTAFVEAVMRTGVPPVDPLYWPGHDVAMRYYYFWYVTCGVVAKMAHISGRQALVASCVWPAYGVAAMLALYGRYLLGWRGARLRRGAVVGVALLSVTGFDVLLVLFNWMGGGRIPGDMEWWSTDQVTSWVDTFLWVPHHAAAMIGCLLAMLLLWMAADTAGLRTKWPMVVMAGLSLAGAFGLSTYVAMATAVLVGFWVAWRMLHEDRWRVAGVVCLAGLVAGCAVGPYLVQLLHHEPGQRTAGRVLGFGIRQMLDLDGMMSVPAMQRLKAVHPLRAKELARLVLLIPGYLIELGFFAAALEAMQWKADGDSGRRTLLIWTWAGLAGASFLRSQVIVTNDFGMRASLLPQFFLLLLGVLALDGSGRWLRRGLLGMAVIGVCGSVFQVVVLRTYLPWSERHGDVAVQDLGERNYVLRDGYAAMQGRVPERARVQYDVSPVDRKSYNFNAEMSNVGRQVVTNETRCNLSFGGEAAACPAIEAGVRALYPGQGTAAPRAQDAAVICGRMGAQYLVATRWDTVWGDRGGWVWTLPAVVERPSMRVVACGR